MGCTSSKTLDEPQPEVTSGTGTPTIHVDQKREADIANRLNTARRPSQFVVGVSAVANKMHNWGQRARAEVAAHGPLVHYSQEDLSGSREDKIVAGLRLLNERLSAHMLWSEESRDDGNCQFRSVAAQFFGDQERHAEIRAAACSHIAAHRDYYAMFFDGSAAFETFLTTMRKDRTWGNELTLRAITDYYGIIMHVVTSTEDNWYLTYEPEQRKCPKQVFISYIAPIHYNSVITMDERDMRRINKHTAYVTKSLD